MLFFSLHGPARGLDSGQPALLVQAGQQSTPPATQALIQIVTADNTDINKKIVDALRRKFPAAQVNGEPIKRAGKKQPLSIAVGPAALRTLLAQGGDGVIVAAFTSSHAYRGMVQGLPEARAATLTAVYADPSPLEQLRLVSMLYKKPSVAILLSKKTAYLEPQLQRAAALSGVRLRVEECSGADDLNRALNRMADASALLAMPDSAVFNQENMRNILLTTYRRNQSVIGFSISLVNAGALASAYSDVDDIAAQLDELVAAYEVSGKLPEAQYPKYFGVAVNEDVARSLNIVLDDAARKLSRRPAPKP